MATSPSQEDVEKAISVLSSLSSLLPSTSSSSSSLAPSQQQQQHSSRSTLQQQSDVRQDQGSRAGFGSLALGSTPPSTSWDSRAHSSRARDDGDIRLGPPKTRTLVYTDLMTKCDNVLNNLRRSRANVVGGNTDSRSAIRKEVSSKFLGKRGGKKLGGSIPKKIKAAWKHRFVCLAFCGQTKVPTSGWEKDELYEAGLGEKVIEFPQIDISADEFRDILICSFPKLEGGGGYQLFKCLPNSRNLEMLSKLAHSSPEHLKQQVGNSRTYILPLQRDLDLSISEAPPDQVKEACLCCGEHFVLSDLPAHISECEKSRQKSQEVKLFEPSRVDISPSPSPLSPVPVTPSPEKVHSPVITIEDYEIISDSDHHFSPSPSSPTYSPITPTNEMTLEKILKCLAPYWFTVEDKLAIDVRREAVLEDALRAGRKKKFDCNKLLRVTFVDESGVDAGGPRREFFRLLALQASMSSFFLGNDCEKFFACNVPAVRNKEYFMLGQYAAMSAVQGGPGFPFFANEVFKYFASGELTNLKVDDGVIPDPEIRIIVSELNSCETDNEIVTVFQDAANYSKLSDTGYAKNPNSLTRNDRSEIIDTLVDFHCTVKVKAGMDQFLDGVKAVGLHSYLQNHPDLLKPLFTSNKVPLTPESIKSMLKTTFTDRENKKLYEAERKAYMFFIDFMDECADEDIGCSLEDILIFYSGSNAVPPLGFDRQPTLVFREGGDTAILPTASTCDIVLRLPTCHKAYEDFKSKMILGVLSNDGFGGP